MADTNDTAESMEQAQENVTSSEQPTEEVAAEPTTNNTAQSRPQTLKSLLIEFYRKRRIHFEKGRVHLGYLYDHFWLKLYELPACIGDERKLLDTSLPEVDLVETAKIFRMGWDEEHYFPNRLAQPFLEMCLFGREEADLELIEATTETLLSFLPANEKEIIINCVNSAVVDSQLLDILKKHCPDVDFSQCESGNEACCLAAKKIMCIYPKKVIELWTPILVGLVDLQEFRFFMNSSVTNVSECVNGHECDDFRREDQVFLPHNVWKTFFYEWPKSKIDYYFAMMNRGIGEGFSYCYRCGLHNVPPQHILGFQDCQKLERTMCRERHNCVLKLIEEQLTRAIESGFGRFGRGRDWNYLIRYRGIQYMWPEHFRLGYQNSELQPDIVVYSLEMSEVLIIPLEIVWDDLIPMKRNEKYKQYNSLVEKLSWIGFHVFRFVITLGSRGILRKDLYRLFREFGMTYKNNSRAMEKISKEILSVSYNDYMYFKDRGYEIKEASEIKQENSCEGMEIQ